MTRILTWFFATHACMVTCVQSTVSYLPASTQYTTLSYHIISEEMISAASVLDLVPIIFGAESLDQ